MKKKILSLIFALCLIVPCAVIFLACNEKEHTINFDLNGGISASTQVERKTITKLSAEDFVFDITKVGYTFNGWEYENKIIFNASGECVNEITLVDNMTFKANFIANNYALTINR